MKIAQLSKKYGLERRAIDYYTSLGLIPYTKEENSNYRIYGESAEIAIKKIIILREVGFSAKKIKEALNNPSYFTSSMWNEHIHTLKLEKEKMIRQYNDMIHYAEELRDSRSSFFHSISIYDTPEIVRIFTHIESKLNQYILNPDGLTEISESLPDDLSNIVNYFVVFIKSIEKKRNNLLTPDSPEVQSSFQKFFQRLQANYGTLVFGLYQLWNQVVDPKTLGFSNDQLETYFLSIKAFGICADWFRDTKTLDAAQDFNRFLKTYCERIHCFDQEIGESSYDILITLITEICNIPNSITKEKIQSLKSQLDSKIDYKEKNQKAGSKDNEYLKQFSEYLYKALCTYIDFRAK